MTAMSAKSAKKKAVKKAVAKPSVAPVSPQPAAAPTPTPAAPTTFVPDPAAAPAPKPAMSGVKVLIIDDDPFISGMYATRLTNDGFAVSSAPDGFQGLKKAAEVKPDVILLDILMPKMDGFETLKRLKEDPSLASIPVLMLTSMGQKEDIERGIRAGAVDYMVKTNTLPVDASDKIKSVLKDRK